MARNAIQKNSVYLAGFLISLVLGFNAGVLTVVFSSVSTERLEESVVGCVVAGV